MKKILVSLISLFVLIGCGSSNKEELNIYTWTYFIPDKIIENFEAETGIKVNVSSVDTNDAMLAKLLSGVTDYDIVSPSTDFVEPLVKLNLIEKLDKSKLENVFNNLNTKIDFLGMAKNYDEGLNYTIPYMLFATGITVNKKYAGTDYVRDLEIFENENFKGRMSMLDDARETLGMVLGHLGYRYDTENLDELEAAKNYLIKIKPNLAKFDNNVYSENLVNGELYVTHGYADAYYQTDDLDNLDFFLPTGALMYIDSMAITKNGKNKENAYKFLEYLFRPENYKLFLEEYRTISTMNNVDFDNSILTEQEIMEKATLPSALSENAKLLQDKIWTEIKLAK